MAGMRAATIAALRTAVDDAATIARYWSHVRLSDDERCWHWLGAVSGRGHGRFQIADRYDQDHRSTIVVIAHRFGYALHHGVDAMLAVPVVAHACDNPLCQNPRHWHESDPSANRRDWARRRREVAGPLSDMRGARGRARAVRDAVRSGDDVDDVEAAGTLPMHRDQLPLLAQPTRTYPAHGELPRPGSTSPRTARTGPERSGPDPGQLDLFDES